MQRVRDSRVKVKYEIKEGDVDDDDDDDNSNKTCPFHYFNDFSTLPPVSSRTDGAIAVTCDNCKSILYPKSRH